MSLETARQCGKFMVEYAKQQATKELLICFYGGEPLLAPLVDLEMMKAVKELAGQDIRPDYILITNGTLIRENICLLYTSSHTTALRPAPDFFGINSGIRLAFRGVLC